MKKVLCSVLAALFVLSMLVACGGEIVDPTPTPTAEATDAPTAAPTKNPVPQKTVTVDEATLRDKIAGSWVAQMVGVTWGASTEFRYQARVIPESEVPVWKSSLVNDAFAQDDLYVEIPFIDAMKENGVDCSLETFGTYFANSSFGLAHANLVGRQNLRAGIPAAEAGHYKNTYHADDIDWQIEADFLGNIYPGMVNDAAARAFEIGHLMNYGDGVYGGVYVAAMHAAALTATSLREVLDAGIAAIPEGTKFRTVIDEVEESYANGDTWEECWRKIEDTWGDDDKCPECSGTMNIDAKLNAAYIHMGLLWGEGDFTETMKISMRCGQDSDCNPSSSAAILGTLYGLSGLPEEYVKDTDYKRQKFAYTDYTLQDCIDISFALAEEIMTKAGGTKEGTTWTLSVDRDVTPVPFEQWPDDELTVYFSLTARAEGNVSISCYYVLPEGAKESDVSVTFDMGDGTVVPAALSSYTYLAPGTYTVTCRVSAGGKTASAGQTVTVDFKAEGKGFQTTASSSVMSPVGGGSKSVSVLTDGVVPKAQEDLTAQYDTFTGQYQSEAWFALEFDHKVTVTDVLFSEGAHFEDGGWFKKAPSVELLIDGKWVKTDTTLSPLYMEVDSRAAQGEPMQTFTFTLQTPTKCEGVRVIGRPGGSASFASCSELDVRYSEVENPTYEVQEQDDCITLAIPYVSEANPTGAGCKDIEIMRDGVLPKAGSSHETVQYDTFRGRADDHEEFFGYIFRGEWTVTDVAFTAGSVFDNGGWFKDGTLHLEVLVDGEWEDVDAVLSPDYPTSDSRGSFSAFKTYTFTVAGGVDCNGIRVIGMAGGTAHFTSVSELRVDAVKEE